MVLSFRLGSSLIETFDVSFYKTCSPSSSVEYFNYRSLCSLPKVDRGEGEWAGEGKPLYQSQWKYKVLIMVNEEIWAFGYFCGSEIF